jgi:hypothetical protein
MELKMIDLLDYPLVFFAVAIVVLWLVEQVGGHLRRRQRQPDLEREDMGVIVGAALTLLGLIIGFTFSMAVSRYDQRKNLEEEEANAIGTEYLRAGLLPPADAAKVRTLLKNYLDQRILFYSTGDTRQLEQIGAATGELQNELWASVQAPAQPTPLTALAVSGMNDVLNSQGYTQAAWWNRIPVAAWGLMAAIAICCNVMIGYDARLVQKRTTRALIMPMIVAISFLMIADLDSGRRGIIRVPPQNLQSLARSLPAQ